MVRLLNGRFIALVILACVIAGCSDDDTPTIPTPVAPKTETFSGEVTANGASTHSFDVSSSGAVTATLKAIGSDNTLVVGFSLGTWISTTSSCNIVLANDAATGGATLTGTMTAAGTLCVRVYDVGNIRAPAGTPYTVEVVHP